MESIIKLNAQVENRSLKMRLSDNECTFKNP